MQRRSLKMFTGSAQWTGTSGNFTATAPSAAPPTTPFWQVRAAIANGVRKMNIGTDVCCAFAEGTKETLDDPNRSIAIDVFMKHPINTVKALALDKIRLVGAEGKAAI